MQNRKVEEEVADGIIMMPVRIATLAILYYLLAVGTAAAPTYHVGTEVPGNPGWLAFQKDFGAEHAKNVMAMASQDVWDVLDQTYPYTTKKYTDVFLTVNNGDSVVPVRVTGNRIHLSAQFLKNLSDHNTMLPALTVVLFREMSQVWQWTGNMKDRNPWALVQGIADYVTVVSPELARYQHCGAWRPSQFAYWNEGNCQTMDFLRYCVTLRPTFVADLNKMMTINNFYSDEFFVFLLGKTPEVLWTDYLNHRRHHQGDQLEATGTSLKLTDFLIRRPHIFASC